MNIREVDATCIPTATRSKPKGWWTKELEKATKERGTLRRLAYRNRIVKNRYYTKCKEVNEMVRKEKEKTSLTSSLNWT